MSSEYDDLFKEPDWLSYRDRVRNELVPMIEASALVTSIIPEDGKADVKFAVELGFSIMMDKPIIAMVQAGTKIPEKLARVVDKFVEIDWGHPEKAATAAAQAMNELVTEGRLPGASPEQQD